MSYHRQESARTPQRTRSTRLVGPAFVQSDQLFTSTNFNRPGLIDEVPLLDHSRSQGESCSEQFKSCSTMATYEPPKFRTFQERKREKERLLAIVAGKELDSPDSASSQPQIVERGYTARTDSTIRPLPRGASPQTFRQDSPIVLPPVGVPLAPSNILPFGNGQSTTRRPLPSPTSAIPYSKSAGIARHGSSGGAIQPASVQTAPQSELKHSATGRRLPKPIPSRSKTVPITADSTVPPVIVGRSVHLPTVPSEINTDYGPQYSRNSSFTSDTVTSVKSLDRYGSISTDPRPLPAPPLGVGPSKSLDRGSHSVTPAFPSRGGPAARSALRGVPEQGSPHRPSVALGDTGTGGVFVGGSSCQSEQMQPSRDSIIEVPILVLPADDTQDNASPPAEATKVQRPGANRGYSFSTIPKISVESFAAEEESCAPPTISIPTFSFPDDPDADPSQGPVIQVDTDNDSYDAGKSRKPIVPIVRAKGHGPSNMTGPGIFCARCDGVIIGRIVTAMDQRWHPECFQCSVCHTLLEHVSSYEHDGRAYCHMDYHDVSGFAYRFF